MIETIVYSCQFGQYDRITSPPVEPGVEYILFTDADWAPAPWKIRRYTSSASFPNPRRLSRLAKINPMGFLPFHKVSIYIDGHLRFKQPFVKWALSTVNEDVAIAAPVHPKTKCLYDEADKVIALRLDEEDIVNKQVAKYRMMGFPAKVGLTENCFMVRRSCPEVASLGAIWWSEYLAGSQRDQLSLMYCLWRLAIPINAIQIYARDNDWFFRAPHLKPREINANS